MLWAPLADTVEVGEEATSVLTTVQVDKTTLPHALLIDGQTEMEWEIVGMIKMGTRAEGTLEEVGKQGLVTTVSFFFI